MMGPQFSTGFILLILPLIFWPVTLTLAIACWVGGKLLRGFGRWICWSLGGVLTLYLLFGLLMVAIDPVSDWWMNVRLQAMSGTLHEPRTVAGALLPAGTKVHWSQTDKSDFDRADLPGTASLMGLKVKGTVYHDLSGFKMTLAEPEEIEEWGCAADEVRIDNLGKLQFCVLGRDVSWHGLVIPVGAGFERKDDGLHFPMPDGRGMTLLGSLIVPPGGELIAYEDGSLKEVHSSWDFEKDDKESLVERGVSLKTGASFYPEPDTADSAAPLVRALGVRSKLMLDLPCARETIDAGQEVEIAAAGNAVRVLPQTEAERRKTRTSG